MEDGAKPSSFFLKQLSFSYILRKRSRNATLTDFFILLFYNVSMGRLKQGTYPLRISITEHPHFSDRLRIAMQIRDCSVEELAASSFVTKSTICSYRSGHRSPNVETLRLLAKNLDVSADFLIGLKEIIYV